MEGRPPPPFMRRIVHLQGFSARSASDLNHMSTVSVLSTATESRKKVPQLLDRPLRPYPSYWPGHQWRNFCSASQVKSIPRKYILSLVKVPFSNKECKRATSTTTFSKLYTSIYCANEFQNVHEVLSKID